MKNSIVKLLVIFSLSFLMMGLLYAEFNPNGGENGEFWQQNTTRTIKWDTSYFHNTVNIYLWNMTSATFTTIDTSVQASLGEYDWVIPDDHPTGSNFRVKIQQTDSALYQFSETFFPIYEGGSPHSDVAEKTNNSENIYISPNPGTDKIKIRFKDEFINSLELQIFSSYGQEIINTPPSDFRFTTNNWRLFELDVSLLSTGMYFAVLNANGKVITKPFVVLH
ncbi:MAG: T9SS type A sorting domain-containing protein [Bacteroidetes bacterium]|nr:MAG: T9SS type A sorting domain-containing protein [Bacteroidota bacterium]